MFKFKLSYFYFICFMMLSFGSLEAHAFDGEILSPNKLNAGDTVCVLESSSTEKAGEKDFEDRLPIVIKNLESRGFNVVVYRDCFKATPLGLGDGTEQLRADLFNKAVRDPEIKAILAFWGGYGSMHTLDKIDYEAFRENRKIFVGFSDETALELAIFEKAGVITFHGPMVGCKINYRETKTFDNLFDVLMNLRPQTELKNIDDTSSFKIYKPGEALGAVIGGNLCLTQCLIGTPYEPDWEDKVLFFEEVEESACTIHRTLWHLKLTGRLDKLAGIIIGTITPVEGETEDELLSACFDVLKDLKIPIVYNVHAGHIKNPLTLPIGSKIKISNNKIYIAQQIIN